MVIRLVLADDHAVVREGVCALLASDPDFEVVGQAGDGAEVLALVERHQPDVVVLDLMMPGAGGLEVTGQLARRADPPTVLILSVHESEAYVVEAMRRGAAGYVLKQAPARELARGIRTVATGARYLSPPLSDRALDAYLRGPEQQQGPEDMLTDREREVLRLAAEGRSNAEVAAMLFISRRTVETHRARAMRKLGLRNQVELARYAIERGIVPSNPPNPQSPSMPHGDAGR
jgi:two-component system response regulator NreC